MKATRTITIILSALILQACVTADVDEMVFHEPHAGIGDNTVVILGRRHASDYETEFEFIHCVGEYITDRDPSVEIISELEFINALYPWFEPRTAPLYPESIEKLLQHQPVADKLTQMKTEYMIWIDGQTETVDGMGTMACATAGCFGFSTWEEAGSYEATIWDFTDRAEVGKVSAATSGQSYMPAVIVPIPILAPVEDAACDSVGHQLLEFLSSEF